MQALRVLTMAMEDVFQAEVLGDYMQLQDKADTIVVSGYICHRPVGHEVFSAMQTTSLPFCLALVMVDQAAPVDQDAQKANFCVVDNSTFWDARIYLPLDPSKKEIRLLRILPAIDNNEIVCELEQNISLLGRPQQNAPSVIKQLGQDYDEMLLNRSASEFEPRTNELLEVREGTASNHNEPTSVLQTQWYHPASRFARFSRIPEGMEYFGLSYAVGETTELETIIVSGMQYSVSYNLVRAIRRLRQLWPGASLRMWIDQVCIDQHNVNERGHQVKMMSAI